MKIILLIFVSALQMALAADGQRLVEPLLIPNEGEVLDIKVDNDGIIYLSSPNGFFKSTDNGDSWIYIFDKGYTKYMNFDKSNNLIINVSSFYNIDSRWIETGYYTTTDKGKTWDYTDDDTLGIIFIDTARNDTYYKLYNDQYYAIGKYRFNIYKSINRGKSWSLINNDIVGKGIYPKIFSIVNDSLVYLMFIETVSTNERKYYFTFSKDFGATWDKIITLPDAFGQLININNDILANTTQGMFISHDTCKSWKPVYLLPGIKKVLQISKDSFYLITTTGIYFTKDFFQNLDKISVFNISDFKILPNGRFIGYGNNTIYISDDSGKAWRESAKGFCAATTVLISFTPWGDLYISDYYPTFRSHDMGKNYEKLDMKRMVCIAYDGKGDIYASEAPDGVQYSLLYKSTDRGKTWKRISEDYVFGGTISRILFNSKGHIFVNSGGGYIYKSTDGGKNWEYRWTERGSVGLAMNSEEHLFGGGDFASISSSTDDGETWEEIEGIKPAYTKYGTKGFLFHRTKHYGYAYGTDFLAKTTDNGRTWNFIKPQYIKNYEAGTVDSSGNIFLIGFDYVFVHLDGEDTMRAYKHNYMRYYTDMQTAPDGSIYVSVMDGGIYRLRLDLIDGLSVEEVEPSYLFAYPNPARDYIEIPGINPRVNPGVDGQIYVYNTLGVIVLSTSVNCVDTSASGGQIKIDVSALPPGVYFVRCCGTFTKFVKGE